MMWWYHSQQQKILHMEVFWKASCSSGRRLVVPPKKAHQHVGSNLFTLSRGWVSHRAGRHLSTPPIFLIPSLTLSSCPSLMERIDQSGSCCRSAGSGRKTCQNLTKQQGNMSRLGLGVAQAASEEHWLCKAGLPLACWQPHVISPAILPISSSCLALPVTQSLK